MGSDYVAFANKTLHEYVRPLGAGSTSCIYFTHQDPFLSMATFYLIAAPHRFDKHTGEWATKRSGSWGNSEFFWVSDYDPIYDGNDRWKTDWNDITAEAFAMLLGFKNGSPAHEILSEVKSSVKTLRLVGQFYEQTKCPIIEEALVAAFGKKWRSRYYHAEANWWRSESNQQKMADSDNP